MVFNLWNITMKYASIAIAAALLVSGAANATTYENAEDIGPICCFGVPDTTNYGQTFTLGTEQTLLDWEFYTNDGSAGNIGFVLAAWDGAKAVGPALYQTTISFSGGLNDLIFADINTTLSAGNYIAYLTVAGVSSPASNVLFAASSSDGGLGGGFRFLNSTGTDPLTLDMPWSAWSAPNMLYTANLVTPAPAVPEPGAMAMLLAGLAGVGLFARRRQA